MNVSMGGTTADRFSVCTNFLRYGSGNVTKETSGLCQAVLWRFVQRGMRSDESTA